MFKHLRQKRQRKRISETVRHDCLSCDWFKKTEANPENRMCKNPKPLTWTDWQGSQCLAWVLAEDIATRELGLYAIVR